jgi:chemotaxis family two-component system sensor histidine kinase/response regulator PixL
MAKQSEQEIKLQFLEEAKEYLTTLESGLVGLSEVGSRAQNMDALLRAAHSLKGGSALMGYTALSDLAHRLEDFLKVIKASSNTLVDGELEKLFLGAVDRMVMITEAYLRRKKVGEKWLQANVHPLFDQIRDRVGDPQAQDHAAVLSAEVGEDMAIMLFETEVEGCLQRLEAIYAQPEQPCLREEIAIASQELGGLGEMLELPAMSQLCQEIETKIQAASPAAVPEIAQQALSAWRQTQVMVIVGQKQSIPRQLENVQQTEVVETQDFESLQEAEAKTEDETTTTDNTETIRVPVRYLDQLGELFGELTIERNGLGLQLKNLRNLVNLLSERVRTLETSNFQLRTAYDQATFGTLAVATADSGYRQSILPQVGEGGGQIQQLSDSFLATLPIINFDTLELDRYSQTHLLSQEVMETIVQVEEVTTDIEVQLDDTERTARALNRTAKLMQTRMTQVRMRPVSDLLTHFPRALRELELQQSKSVDLKIRGGSTLIDRAILEALNEPLLHLLRNAFDHGIEDPQTRIAQGKAERGTIEISASYHGNQTVLTLRDDGRGINLDKIRQRARQMGWTETELVQATQSDLLDLIFTPGFSTADQVTNLSGRGVGMDVVKTNIQQVRGEVQVDTQPGQGTTFTLTVPFNLSVMRVLLVESQGMRMAFPTNTIEEMLLLDPSLVVQSAGQEVLNWEGEMLPLVRMQDWLHFPRPPQKALTEEVPKINAPTVLVVAQGEHLVGLVVDRYWGEQEVTIRQVEGNLMMPSGFAGCTILGDGRIVPLMDALAFLESTKGELIPTLTLAEPNPELPTPETAQNLIMVVDDSINVRRYLAFTLEKAGYQIEQAKDGQEALEKLKTGLPVKGVVCDIEMPRLDGYGFLIQVKTHPDLKEIPVMMLTSRSGEKHRQAAMNLGATAYFSKPFKEKELLQTLEEICQPSILT